ncbi:MAG: hypothetical protein DRI74_05450 [Bacteroidetes bacterium]|nr:MAG: hypothetical protein DRI74_05450 [Bacteroidota bacterium]
MILKPTKIFLVIVFFVSGLHFSFAQSDDKVMIVIIDGARYTETFGDMSKTYIPKMWDLAEDGTIIDNFENDKYTYTSRAIPALWCGAWTDVQSVNYQGSNTSYAVLPTIFEYYRKQKNMPADECFYILKYIPDLWLPSFDADYGPDYWPQFHSVGANDRDVATQAQLVIDNYHPHFMLVYLADVDHAGHSGIWTEYTSAIQIADSIVDVLWKKLQSDPFYENSTTLIVTNDHGRHDDQHGGFQGHGCSCDGCRHIQFLAVGPDIRKNFVSSQYHNIPDMAVTASYILGVEPTKATGNIIQEIFNTTGTNEEINQNPDIITNYPNPFNKSTTIDYFLYKESYVYLSIFDISGKEVINLVNRLQFQGQNSIVWDATDSQGKKVLPGIYFYNLQIDNQNKFGKLMLVAD